MNHLKNFNESMNSPSYKRGEVFIFSKKNLDIQFVNKISLSYDSSCQEVKYGNAFIIKTPIGAEIEIGKSICEDYPEFFSNYERRDISIEYFSEKIDQISSSLESLHDYLGNLNKFKKPKNPNWNSHIDDIIDQLNNLKT